MSTVRQSPIRGQLAPENRLTANRTIVPTHADSTWLEKGDVLHCLVSEDPAGEGEAPDGPCITEVAGETTAVPVSSGR